MSVVNETPEARDARLEELLIELIDVAEKGDRTLVEEFLSRHPEEEPELRSHLAALAELSLLEGGDAATTPPPFDAVDDFRLLRPLGRGGMGEVWLAEQMSLRRPVAIKVIRAGAGAGERARERFRREARAMALIDDPHVARVHGSGTHPSGVDWIAMEYVPGRGLDEVFAEAGRDPGSLGSKRLITWGVQIAGALSRAHEAGVVHRDIKPSNIRIRPDGRAVLIDFGLSRHLHEGSLSQSGDFIGSPHYAAPEQLSSDVGEVGPTTDVYSLALTLYEGLTGLRPFEGESTEEVFRRILHTDPPRPRRLSSRVSRDLETVLLTALNKEPARRYAGARAFGDDLLAYVDGRAIRARPESRARRIARWTRRHPARATLAAFILVTAIAGTWIMWKIPEIRRLRAEERRWAVEDALENGATFHAVGLIDDARVQFHEALRLDPNDRDAMVGYALTLLEGRREDELFGWLDQEDRSRPGDRLLALIRRQAMRIHGRPGEMPEVEGPHDAVESFFLGHIALATGQNDVAYESLQNANLIAAESRPPYVFDFIQAASASGRAEEAARFLELARLRWPGHPVADFIEASLISRSEPDRAATLLEAFLERLPRSASAWMNLGLARFRAGDPEGAITSLRNGLEIAPHHDPMRCSLGEILYRSGHVDEAITEFEAVVLSDAEYQDAWYQLAHCRLVLRNDPAAALAPAARAVALDPEDDDARDRLVIAARWTGSYETLAAAATAALMRKPQDLATAVDLLRAHVELGRPADAAAALAATEAASDSPAAMLAALAERWDELASGDRWRTGDLEVDDRLALIRIFRARGEHAEERALVERLREDEPEERELECHAEIARSDAISAARGDEEAWTRVLDHLEVVYDVWTPSAALWQPRPSLMSEFAPIFDAERRATDLPASLRDGAARLAARVARIHASNPPF